jgi:hypothetical protein
MDQFEKLRADADNECDKLYEAGVAFASTYVSRLSLQQNVEKEREGWTTKMLWTSVCLEKNGSRLTRF